MPLWPAFGDNWITTVRWYGDPHWYTQVLAFANPDFYPLWIDTIECAGPHRNFPYGVDVVPDDLP